MIPYDIDPSLHTGEPESTLLEDGFSPPHHAHVPPPAAPEMPPPADAQADAALPVKSSF